MITLGLNAPPRGWHDTAACLVINGKLIAFGEEERFSRRKHAVDQPPHKAIAFCLEQAALSLDDVDVIAVGWDIPKVIKQDQRNQQWLNPESYLQYVLGVATRRKPELVFVPHHLAHATCAFFASPFPEAAVLVVDGIGEDRSVSIYSASTRSGIKELQTWPPSHSLGLMYDGACQSIGLSFLESGKLMGLAAFGRAKGIEPWSIFDFAANDYSLALPAKADDTFHTIVHRWRETFRNLQRGAEICQDKFSLHEDETAVRTAWSAQHCVEEVMQWLAALTRSCVGKDQLCVAGGVALNCSANGLLPDPVYIPPVAHDSGTALGAAWHVSPPVGERLALSPYFGLCAGRVAQIDFTRSWEPFNEATVIEWLLEGKIGGVVEGRAEIGPRALCHRSIIALPTPATQQDRVNALKRREPWRPFAPVGLAECNGELWSERSHLFKYMLGATNVTKAGEVVIPATIHVDGTARPQIVDENSGMVAQLLSRMRAGGMAPVLLNTSFNGPCEPIVNSKSEAIDAMTQLGLDFLILGDRTILAK